ncbi:MAG TPA: trypsin-like peptidase domain-containing protein [Ktedonobacterales bacterium]
MAMMMTPPSGEQASGEQAPRQEPDPATPTTPANPYDPADPAQAQAPQAAYPPPASATPVWESYFYGNQQPPVPPYTAPAAQPPAPRRPRWSGALIAAALLVALLLGGGAGALITNSLAARNTSGGSAVTIGPTSAPSVSVSSNVTGLEASIQSVAAAVEPSVVKITSVGSGSEAVGSGDILTSDGYIVTNDHVVAGYTSYSVTIPSGSTYTAQLVGQDAQDDLAVLKITATGLKPIAIATSTSTVGAFTVAVGYPLGLQESATFGVVSGLNRAVSEAPSGPAGELVNLIQTSAQLNPGNSGGALVNLKGQLIGIPTLEATNTETNSSANGVGYAIPASRVTYVVKQLIASGKLTSTGQGFLGIQSQDTNGQGVQVAGFTNDISGVSPAQAAGLQSGDVITAINGQTVTSSDDVAAAVLTRAPGTAITVTVQRGSGAVTLTVKLGERPVSS